ncbi:MAG: N-acetylmuramoyl-L-alanine amidase [Candidatus Merdivicinus sp.]|jgi:N-acetylmuramoyl-L-alanine amidase
MPRIYLSPSTQEFNLYNGGGNEEYYMNLVADAMIPLLQANTIRYTRNTPDMTAASSIQQSKQGHYDFYLALHSNASPEGQEGTRQGAEVYYAPNSRYGRIAAELIAANLREIYPYPEKVRTLPTTTLGEVVKTNPPAVLVEFAYHDNAEDAEWIRQNIQPMAEAIVRSLTEYFGLPYAEAIIPHRLGKVNTVQGNLNLRQRPTTSAPVLARLPRGSEVILYGQWEDWYSVNANGKLGYVREDYILPGPFLANE